MSTDIPLTPEEQEVLSQLRWAKRQNSAFGVSTDPECAEDASLQAILERLESCGLVNRTETSAGYWWQARNL